MGDFFRIARVETLILLRIPSLAVAGIVGIAFLVYWPILTDFFALDDFTWLRAATNPDVPDFLRRAFTSPRQTTFEPTTPFWRPLIDMYFFVQWRIWGFDSTGYHIGNVAIHGINASLVAMLAWQITSSRLTAFASGVLFVVLPTYDFAVTWISSVTELLAALFYLLTLVFYMGYLRRSRPSYWRYWGALASLLLALLAKESTITIPVVLVGLVVVVNPPRSVNELRQTTLELIPFAALTLAYSIFRYVEQYDGTSKIGLYQFGSHAWANLWDYLKWMVLPIPDGRASWVGDTRPFAAAAFLGAGIIAVVLRAKVAAFAFGWTLLALVPYLFFLAGVEYRYTYIASIPLAIALAVLLGVVRSRIAVTFNPPIALVASVAILIPVATFLAAETRDRQAWLSTQAELYGQLFREVPVACDELPRESTIYLINVPIVDIFGTRIQRALNFAYDDVYVERVSGTEPPEGAVGAENKCVVRFSNGQYSRVSDQTE